MRVLSVLLLSTSSGSRGGGELYLLKLAQGLKAAGVRPVLACSDHSKMDELAAAFSRLGPVHRIPLINCYDTRLKSLSYIRSPSKLTRAALHAIITGEHIDLIHLNKQNMEDGLDLIQILREDPTPWIQTIHIPQMPSDLGARWGRFRDWVSRRYLASSPAPTIVVSRASAQQFARHLPENPPPTIVINGSQERRSAPRELLPERPLRFLAVSRLHAQKRPDRWIEWVDALHPVFPDAQFDWVGDGLLEDRYLPQFGERPYIQYYGWQQDPAEFIRGADYLLHAADYEGLPFAWVEAIAHGLPILCTHELAASVTECLPAITTWESLSSELESLADPETYRERSASAIDLHAEGFSIDQMVQSTIRVYRQRPDTAP